jgi:hypothetical protein
LIKSILLPSFTISFTNEITYFLPFFSCFLLADDNLFSRWPPKFRPWLSASQESLRHERVGTPGRAKLCGGLGEDEERLRGRRPSRPSKRRERGGSFQMGPSWTRNEGISPGEMMVEEENHVHY